MDTIILKNGSEEVKQLVIVVMHSLHGLLSTEVPPMEAIPNGLAFYDLVMKCRNHNHQISEKSEKILKGLSLIESNGEVHQSIRNIVLSAANGDDLEITLLNPIKENQ